MCVVVSRSLVGVRVSTRAHLADGKVAQGRRCRTQPTTMQKVRLSSPSNYFCAPMAQPLSPVQRAASLDEPVGGPYRWSRLARIQAGLEIGMYWEM